MKKGMLVVVIIIVVIVLMSFRSLYTQKPTKVILPKPTSPVSSSCTPQNVQASLELHPGAGNVYGTFTLKNISNRACQILGGKFIEAKYDTNSVKNIKITHLGQNQSQPFTLSPNQTLYSQVHYPNGPQCSTRTQPVNVTFTYKISPTEDINFKNQNGETQQAVQTCQLPTEITEIQIWNMANKPITP